MLNFFKEIFSYSEGNPLFFTKVYFWFFFAFVLFFYSFLYKRQRIRNIYLLIVSLFFYYKTSGMFFLLLLFSTLSDYTWAWLIYYSKRQFFKKTFLCISIIINLLLLGYFKYAYFFTDSFNNLFHTDYQVINYFAKWSNSFANTHFSVSKILLPVGISFFTFQTISYSVDVYRKKLKPVKNIFDFAFYVSFFPQLVSGPIVRASEFIPQLYKEYNLSKKLFAFALFMILSGLIKKLAIGDYIAVNFVDRVFATPSLFSGFENLMALYAYSLQVYVDFSGYTDIAIGTALLLGFRLPQNFNSPYKAKNVGEFWKRWHISLSSWLKDYLYIPLGGNRYGSVFTYISIFLIIVFIFFISANYLILILLLTLLFTIIILSFFLKKIKRHFTTNINLMITMLLGGLWHGASWQFVYWGGINGLGLIFYKYWRKISPWTNSKSLLNKIFAIFLTFNFITFTRIWFRSNSMEGVEQWFYQVFNNFDTNVIWPVIKNYYSVFLIIFIGYLIHFLPVKWKSYIKINFILLPLWIKLFISILIIILIYQFMVSDLLPFIYFQF